MLETLAMSAMQKIWVGFGDTVVVTCPHKRHRFLEGKQAHEKAVGWSNRSETEALFQAEFDTPLSPLQFYS